LVLSDRRSEHEVAHGQRLNAGEPEALWGWGTPAGRERARRRAQMIAEGAGLARGVRALEVGCGTGMFTEMFAASGADLVAVDISPDLLARARERKLSADHVMFVEKRFEDCDVDGPFDAVIGSSVLHHIEIAVALRRIHDLLKPGGRLSFAEPNYLNPQVFLERKLRFLPCFDYVSPDETAFVRGRLTRQLRGTGFSDVEVAPFDWLHPATPDPYVSAVGRTGRLLARLPLIREFAGSLYIRGKRPE